MPSKSHAHGQRNQTIELFRVMAALFVVLIHFPLPGICGECVSAIARYAVPFFFILTGYYSFEVETPALRRRIKKMVVLVLVASVIYLPIMCLFHKIVLGESIREYLISHFNAYWLSRAVLLGRNPFSEHLWFLSATLYLNVIVLCYGIVSKLLYGKVRYHLLYCCSAAALLIALFSDLFLKSAGVEIDLTTYRNYLFVGLPLFSLGLMLREIENQHGCIRISHARAIALVTAFGLMSIVQSIGIGQAELPIGAIGIATTLFLVAHSRPIVSERRAINTYCMLCSDISKTIYIIHPAVFFMLQILGKYSVRIDSLNHRALVSVCMILFISYVIAFLYSLMRYQIRRNSLKERVLG